MMDGDNPKPGLDFNFRQYALRNLIIKTLKEWTHNSEDPNVINKINRISHKFEEIIYKAATNREDYLRQMSYRLKKSKNKVLDAITANATGNQPVSSAIQNPTQQNPERAPLTSMQQTDIRQPVLNKDRQYKESSQHNDSPAYHVSVAEPVQTSNYMSNMDRYRHLMEVVPQVSNSSVPDLAASSRARILIHENKSTLQSPLPAANAPTDSTALSASTYSGTVNAGDWQDIIERFQGLKTKLPVIRKLVEFAEYQCARAPNAEQIQKYKENAMWFRKMIQFLHIPEKELTQMSKEKSTCFMNYIMHSLHNARKIDINDQVEQSFSNRNSQQSSGTSSSSPYAPQNATLKVSSQHLLYQGPRRNPDHNNAGVEQKQNQQLIQKPIMNQAPLSTPPKNLQEKRIDLVNSRTNPVPKTHEPSSVLSKPTNDGSVHLISTGINSKAIPSPAHLPLNPVRSPAIPEEIPAVSPQVTTKPIKRLMEVVQSMSRGALIESVNDIFSVSDFLSCPGEKSCHKRPRIEKSNCVLMEEVAKMNRRLLETTIDVVSDSNEVAGVHGTVVRFTYRPVGSLAASFLALSAFSVKLNVPSDYPNVSPQLLDGLSEECSEAKDLLEKILKIFRRDIRRLSIPVAIGDMAQAWDNAARSVCTDYALSIGAKCLSSMYGTWECVPS